MTLFKPAAVLLTTTLLLGACVTSADQKVAAASKELERICATEPAAYVAFTIIASQTQMFKKQLNIVHDAHVAIQTVCANPPQDVASGLAIVAAAYANILDARAHVAKSLEL